MLLPMLVTSWHKHWLIRSLYKFDFELTYYAKRQVRILESEHSTDMVSSAYSAASLMKVDTSLPRLSRIFIRGSR